MAGATRPPVLPLRGLGANAWTLVLAAKEDQVHCVLLRHGSLDPHLHRADHGWVGQLGRRFKERCQSRSVWTVMLEDIQRLCSLLAGVEPGTLRWAPQRARNAAGADLRASRVNESGRGLEAE